MTDELGAVRKALGFFFCLYQSIDVMYQLIGTIQKCTLHN